jgi:hypothetical protein
MVIWHEDSIDGYAMITTVISLVLDDTDKILWSSLKDQVKPTFIATKKFGDIRHTILHCITVFRAHEAIWGELEDKHYGNKPTSYTVTIID